MVVLVAGVWGCAQGPSGSASVEKIKALEAKVARQDDDLRAAGAARDQYRKKLNDSEQANTQLKQEIEALQLVVKERDELRGQLQTTTKERDETRQQLKTRTTELVSLTTQFETFRKTLKDLIGQTEAALFNKPAGTVGTTVSFPKSQK